MIHITKGIVNKLNSQTGRWMQWKAGVFHSDICTTPDGRLENYDANLSLPKKVFIETVRGSDSSL